MNINLIMIAKIQGYTLNLNLNNLIFFIYYNRIYVLNFTQEPKIYMKMLNILYII